LREICGSKVDLLTGKSGKAIEDEAVAAKPAAVGKQG
jgi:hypothetical protein